MTVKEFIELLKTYNQEAKVLLADWGERYRAPWAIEEGDVYTNGEKVVLGDEDFAD